MISVSLSDSNPPPTKHTRDTVISNGRHLLPALLALLFLPVFSYPQKKKALPLPDENQAAQYFQQRNYFRAREEYEILINIYPDRPEYNYRLGVCYLNTNIDKSKALPLLQKVTASADVPVQAWYDLGRAYQYSYQFEEAIDAFLQYKSLNTRRDDNMVPVDRQLEMCRNAIDLLQSPPVVTFENAGTRVNSPWPDFNPFTNEDGSLLVFTSKRPGNLGGLADYDGFPTSDIFICEQAGDQWKQARRIPPPVNSNMIDEVVWLSADASMMIIYAVNNKAENDIFMIKKKGKHFGRPENPGPRVNQPRSVESGGCFSPDGRMFLFSSDRAGGYGKSDIYYCTYDSADGWSRPVNAGPGVNTAFDEDYPGMGGDQAYLYFASQGHNSMGGFDIFRSRLDYGNMTFGKAENLGYPVNSPENNFTISFFNQGKSAYVSALRPGGSGNLDIWRIDFK